MLGFVKLHCHCFIIQMRLIVSKETVNRLVAAVMVIGAG